MEKFGLFDLIDKFNSVASGKNDFNKVEKKPTSTKVEESTTFIDPQIFTPQHYLMNAKLLAFHKKHDETLKKISLSKK
jgi:hypothetical protein